MDHTKFAALKNDVQEIIDLIAKKQTKEANNKLLDDLHDFSEEDEDLLEISRYQVLLNHLYQKIHLASEE